MFLPFINCTYLKIIISYLFIIKISNFQSSIWKLPLFNFWRKWLFVCKSYCSLMHLVFRSSKHLSCSTSCKSSSLSHNSRSRSTTRSWTICLLRWPLIWSRWWKSLSSSSRQWFSLFKSSLWILLSTSLLIIYIKIMV
jgi:hypothetical protein